MPFLSWMLVGLVSGKPLDLEEAHIQGVVAVVASVPTLLKVGKAFEM